MILPFGFKAECRSKPIIAAFAVSYRSKVGLAQPASGREQRIEYGFKIKCRAADHLEHIGGRSLLLQGFCQFVRARLHLVEQPAVFTRDARLVGEGSDQLDMLAGKRLNSAAREENNANRNTLAKQWHAERRPIVSDAYDSAQLVFGIGLNVRNLD